MEQKISIWLGLGGGVVLAGVWFLVQGRGVILAQEKSTEAKKVGVRLLTEEGKVSSVWVVPKVVRSDKEWALRLSPEQFRVGRTAGTERAFCGVFHDNHEQGIYFCAGCGLPLFRSDDKFDSGTGWPSFFQPFAEENLGEETDSTLGMSRTEVNCVRCDMHLGHVFPDGPKPTGLRYCINSAVLDFQKKGSAPKRETIYLAAGCFWGVEEVFEKLPGVKDAEVGYAGGTTKSPTYETICSHTTGHAEVVKLEYEPEGGNTGKLLETFFKMHDPTTLNRQGPDVGDQYRSAIFFTRLEQESVAREEMKKAEKAKKSGRPIVTQIDLAGPYTRGEEYHQNYFEKNGGGHCHVPKN